jgi:hypothetical protein
MLFRRAQARLEPTDEAGQVGGLRAVERVQPVHDEKAQRLRGVETPEGLLLRAEQ